MLKIRFKLDIDRWILYFSFIEMLFLRWVLIGQDTIIMLFCTILVIRLLLAKENNSKVFLVKILMLLSIFLYIFVRSILSIRYNSEVLFQNVRMMVLPVIIILYFGYLVAERKEMVNEVFLRLRIPLNIYYMVNFVIILMQRDQSYFLMDKNKMINTYYLDHMAGLLGLDGTHRLALVTVFIVLLNIYYLKFEALKTSKRVNTILGIVVVILTAVYTSAINDNNMLFLLMPVTILMFYMIGNKNNRGKWFKIAIVGTILFALMYLLVYSNLLTDMLGSRIGRIVDMFIDMFSTGNVVDERTINFMYVIEECNAFRFGLGFGTIRMRHEPTIMALGYEFRNWGMADISPFIAMGGIWFYIIYLFILAKVIYYKNNRMCKYAFALLLLLTYYHQVLTHSTMTIPMCWIFAIFMLMNENKASN